MTELINGITKLRTVFDLYVKFREFEAQQSQELWISVDTIKLDKGAEQIHKEVRRCVPVCLRACVYLFYSFV